MALIGQITATNLGTRKGKGDCMKKLFVTVAGAFLLAAPSAHAQEVCVGDCNADQSVGINELIMGVNIALGSTELSACPDFDADDSGTVEVSELIQAVNNALGSCDGDPPPPEGVCGNEELDDGEECDDGNNFGGDGCAANCTDETSRAGEFDSARTIAFVQTEGLGVIQIPLEGSQVFRTGSPRDTDTELANGEIIPAGNIPVVLRASELVFEPVIVPGLVCACVRGAVPEGEVFGPQNFGMGSVACGDQPGGLTDISYVLTQDHNTNPGDNCNLTDGSADDADCSAVSELPGGLNSLACLEGGDDDRCDDEENRHINVCNGPRVLERTGGPAPRGSAFFLYNTQIGLLQDGGSCRMDRPQRPGGDCLYVDYGPDCTPCTDDDLQKGDPENIPATTAMAEAAVFDANNNNSSRCSRAVTINAESRCGGTPCQTRREGALFDCDALLADPSGGIEGAGIALAYPSIDARTIADNVTSTVFFNRAID